MSERGQLQIITTKILCHKLTSSCLLGSVTDLPITCRLFLFCRVLVSNLSLSAKIYVKIKIWCSLILVQSVQNCLSFEMHVEPPQTCTKLSTAVILFNWAHLIGCKCKAAACIVCMGAKNHKRCCCTGRYFIFCQTKLINLCLSTSTRSNFIWSSYRSTPHNTYTHLHTWLTCSIWLSVDCWLWSMPFFLDVAAILSLVLSSHFWMISFLFICDSL